MTKKKQEDQKEQETEKLSEWQKRNKEYLEKKAQEEAEKEKELAEQKKQHLPNSEKKKVEKNDESAEEDDIVKYAKSLDTSIIKEIEREAVEDGKIRDTHSTNIENFFENLFT